MAEGRVSRLNAFCVKDATGKVLSRGKVAVILHRMPITGEPFRGPEQKRAGKTAGPDSGDNRVPGGDKGSAAA